MKSKNGSSPNGVPESLWRERFEALEKGNSGHADRMRVMGQLDLLFTICFPYEVNPLQSLRDHLPEFKWTHTQGSSTKSSLTKQIRRIVVFSDFIWLLPNASIVSVRNESREKFDQPFLYTRVDDKDSALAAFRDMGVTLLPHRPEPLKPKPVPPFRVDPKPPTPQPFVVGDQVAALSTPIETPSFFVSMGKGVVLDRDPRTVDQIWHALGSPEWLLTLKGQPGMFYAKWFKKV